jgi:hypothetical protein
MYIYIPKRSPPAQGDQLPIEPFKTGMYATRDITLRRVISLVRKTVSGLGFRFEEEHSTSAWFFSLLKCIKGLRRACYDAGLRKNISAHGLSLF